MISANAPYYTYKFGSMGQTLDTAKQTHFFEWFHMTQTEQTPHEPGRVTRFRPSGQKFQELCFLDLLEASDGAMVQMELVVQRAFMDGPDGLFAQDLIKSFLIAALPDACRHLMEDFMCEIQSPGARGRTPGWLVFRGKQDQWATQTGWSRVLLTNVIHKDGPAFVIQVRPNPEAPNARPIESKRGRIEKVLALFGLAIFLCACSSKPVGTPELSLKGSWKVTSQSSVRNCEQEAPVRMKQVTLDIQEAPVLNHAASSFDFQEANVIGTAIMTLQLPSDHPRDVTSGVLVGAIVKTVGAAGASSLKLQGYVLSNAEYGAWIAKKKQSPPPPDSGEVELTISGDALHGYTLTGEVRSNEACGRFSHLDAVTRDLTGQFGRGVPAEWSAAVTLEKQRR